MSEKRPQEAHLDTKQPSTHRPLPRRALKVATVTVVLSSYDDYPIHQTDRPIAHPVSGDPGHYDRYFFNGYNSDGSVYFALALGVYPNRHVIDASFSVVQNGKQISLHASARAPLDRMQCTSVGPISIEVLTPLRRLAVRVNSPEHAIFAELIFEGETIAYEEPHFHLRSGVRDIFSYTRLTQIGHWDGWLESHGQRIQLDQTTTFGSRDRSWGVRPVGERVAIGAPTSSPQFYWLWAPVRFANFATHFDINEHADGTRWHQTAARLNADDTVLEAQAVDYSIEWQSGTRHMQNFQLRYQFGNAQATLDFTPLVHFQMLGLGYGHPEWGHGMWKGESAQGAEEWDLPISTPLSPTHLHVQTLCRVAMKDTDGTQHDGMGILETLVIGPHQPSNFVSILDGAQ